MEIIRRGKLPESATHTWVCKNCKSEIKSKRSEGAEVTDHRDGDAVIFLCPLCRMENWISVKLFRK